MTEKTVLERIIEKFEFDLANIEIDNIFSSESQVKIEELVKNDEELLKLETSVNDEVDEVRKKEKEQEFMIKKARAINELREDRVLRYSVYSDILKKLKSGDIQLESIN